MTDHAANYQYLRIWQAAQESELGIVLRVSNVYAARAALYDARHGDPTLAELQIRASPNDTENELWIIKRDAAAATVSMEAMI